MQSQLFEMKTASEPFSTPASASPKCVHCGNPVPPEMGGGAFCCHGCETVYALLNERGLGRYYELKAKGRPVRSPLPAPEDRSGPQSYAYLDDPEFLRLYASPETGGARTMKFYLEGVHCAACVWLTEMLPELVPGVELLRLDLGSAVALVRVSEQGSFASAARELARLGYRPHPVNRVDSEALRRKEDRLALARLGVAAACTGNIMLLAVSLYAGADGALAARFRWLSLALFVPVLFFSAAPFFRSAWRSLRARQASIDIPIVFGLVLGSGVSVFNLTTGSEQVYFDSLAALVFLLLASRIALGRAQRSAMQASRLAHFLAPSLARRKLPGAESAEVPVDSLKPGDRIEVLAGESFPVDGIIEQGASTVNCALLTGESALQTVGPGSPVFAGTVNTQAPLELRVAASGGGTRLGRILASMENSLARKASIVSFADRVSRLFVAAVVLLSGAILASALVHGNWSEALNRALALSILACPCAFALTTPLAMSRAIARCARGGVLVKGGDVLEKLGRVERVYLDKTGTLTEGRLEVSSWEPLLEGRERADLEAAVFALESRSNHPAAHALRRHLRPRLPAAVPQVDEFRETIGTGISGSVGGRRYEITRARDGGTAGRVSTPIEVRRDGTVVARAELGDRVRADSRAAVAALARLGVEPWILSGDARAAVDAVADQVGIPRSRAIAEATPEAKRDVVARARRALMVGDGANDAVALAAAYAGVAVHSGAEISMRAADAYQSAPGVSGIQRLIVVARETDKVIRAGFAVSIAYNLAGGIAAVLGKVDPLFAAVLMPVSAFTVFGIAMAGTRRLRNAFREFQP